jgi:hypothetical protein
VKDRAIEIERVVERTAADVSGMRFELADAGRSLAGAARGFSAARVRGAGVFED